MLPPLLVKIHHLEWSGQMGPLAHPEAKGELAWQDPNDILYPLPLFSNLFFSVMSYSASYPEFLLATL